VEWGLTTDEFEKEDITKIMKYLEYKQAISEGEKALNQTK
jgi:hypothetical protein